ncbi:MAG: cell division protein ZapA [Oscillospiraceae bacterium]|nr:cell division protein ZapA [Oscillospiraceae bacterium]
MEERTTTVVKINNSEYSISSSASEEYVRSVSYYVDKKIQELTSHDRRLSTSMAAVLACVNIADELFQARESCDELTAKTLELANEAGETRLKLDKKTAECDRLTNENQALRINIARLETKLENAGKRFENTGKR